MTKLLQDMTEPELGELLCSVAKAVNSKLSAHLPSGHKPMFAVLVFDDPKIAQYISSCERSCMIEALRETADRLERRMDVPREERNPSGGSETSLDKGESE